MPLKAGKSHSAIAYNVRLEKRHGKKRRQAVAIALHKAGIRRKARGKTRRKKKHV